MPEKYPHEENERNDGDVMAGDRRIARPDTSLPDWYVSDAAYRPLPIVWFAGAMILQVLAQPAIFVMLEIWFNFPPVITIGAALLASGLIWYLADLKGMGGASLAWRLATAAMLTFFFSLTAVTALA